MFGHESKPCKVYEYGCLVPIAGEDALIEEIQRRQQFWNKLVEIEHAHRAKVRELLIVPDDTVMVKEVVSALQGQATELREQIAAAKIERDSNKKTVAEVNRMILEQLEKERREAVKAVTADSGLYWVNYEEVRNSYEQARKKAMRDKTEIKFHHWDGTGKVTVRFQKGLPVPDIFKNDTRLQIDPVSPEAWEHPVRGMRRKMAQTKIRLRVTSDHNKKPVWVELPMVMHRPIPDDSEIRSASIVRERVGRKWRYKVVITATITQHHHMHGKGTVGIDIGLRQVPDGLLVAYWADDCGGHGQLVLGQEVLHEFEKCDHLRSIRDNHFNEIKTDFSAWLSGKELPNWLREKVKSLPQWRSQGKLVSLVHLWCENRFDGDIKIFEQLSNWLKREIHLYDWEANLRDQVRRRRREIYRIYASNLVKKYDTVVLEDFNLRKIAKKPGPEQGTRSSHPMGRQRFIASISELRLSIKNAFQQAGAEYIFVEAGNSTIECAECGHNEKFEASAKLWRTCPKCKEIYDQDYNDAINLLRRSFRKLQVI